MIHYLDSFPEVITELAQGIDVVVSLRLYIYLVAIVTLR